MGIKALRKIQMGKEGTPGVKQTATTVWRGTGVLEDTRETVFVEEDVGILPGVDRTVVSQYRGELSMDSIPATFEQLPLILSAAVSSASASAEGSGYYREYIAGVTTAPAIDTYTLEGGDDEGAEYMAYAFVDSFQLSGEAGGVLEMSADWVGRQVIPSVFTASVPLPEVESIPFSAGKLYIDPVTAVVGTTQITGTWLGVTVNYNAGRKPVFTGDGNLYYNFVKHIAPEATVEFTLEYNAATIAEVAHWRAQTPRQIKMVWTGADLGTAGSGYSKKTIELSLAGKWESFSGLADADGNDTITGTFRARYNSTAALFFGAVVVNNLAALL